MKKWLTLCLVLLMLLGVSASSWAADGDLVIDTISVYMNSTTTTISQNNVSSTPISNSAVVTITGHVEISSSLNHDVSVTGATTTSFTKTLESGQLRFTIVASGSNLRGRTLAIASLYGNSIPLTFNVIDAPSMTAANVVVTCSSCGTVNASSTSGSTFYYQLPAACTDGHYLSFSFRNLNTANGTSVASINGITNPSDYRLFVDTIGTSGTSVTVVLENSVNEKATYTLRVSRASNNASFTAVLTDSLGNTYNLSNGSTYTIPENATTSATLRVTRSDANATTSVNGLSASRTSSATANPGVYSLNLSSATTSSSNNLTITGTAQNGTTTSTQTYSIRRAASTSSSNNTLTSLSASGCTISPSFSTSTTSYTFTVPSSYTSVTLNYGLPSGAQARVVLPSGTRLTASSTYTNYSTGTSAVIGFPTSITAGSSQSFTLQVRAADGTSTKSYSITLTRESSSTTNTLTSLSASGCTISPSFSTSTTSYTFTVPNSYTSVTLNYGLPSGAQARVVLPSGTRLTASSTYTSFSTRTSAVIGFPTTISSGSSQSFTLEVRSPDGASTRTYNITLRRDDGSGNARLSNLYIQDVRDDTNASRNRLDMDRSFSSSVYNYTMAVDYDTDIIYVYPVRSSSSATVTMSVSGGSYDSYWSNSDGGYFRVRLREGSNEINIRVTQSGTTNTYTVDVTRSSQVVRNVSLSNLRVRQTSSSGSTTYSLSPSFSYSITDYTVNVPTNRSEAYLHLTTYQSSASVSVTNATRVSDGVYRVDLSSGRSRTCTITVNYNNSRTSYRVTLNSGNDSALLRNLIVSSSQSTSSSYRYSLLPSFDAQINDYLVIIPYDSDLSEVYVQATLDNTDDTLRVDGSTTSSGAWRRFSISPGKVLENLRIAVDDGDDVNTYYLTIYAAPRNGSDTNTLRDLYLRTGSSSSTDLDLSPSFSSSTNNYTATVSNSTDTVRVYARPTDSESLILVNDRYLSDDYVTIDLSEGRNTISVVVYAEDGRTRRTYTINLTRGTSNTSTVSSLSNLEVRTNTELTLSMVPGFSSGTTYYKVNAPDDITGINFRATASDSGAAIRILGSTITSGVWTSSYNIASGTNSFNIIVTAADGNSSTTYTVVVERGLTIAVSNHNLAINGAAVTSAAYNINGNNYFKLRDIAYALRGTSKNFNVTYNDVTRVITVITGQDYVLIGGEMVQPSSYRSARLSDQSVNWNSAYQNIAAYNIDGNNYFMLRDIAQLLNCGLVYDEGTGTMRIDTSQTYSYSDNQ